MDSLLQDLESEAHKSRYLPSELIQRVMDIQTRILRAIIPIVRIAAVELELHATGKVVDVPTKLIDLRKTFNPWEEDDHPPWKDNLPNIAISHECKMLVQAAFELLKRLAEEEEEIMQEILQRMESNIKILDRIYQPRILPVSDQASETHASMARHHHGECTICKQRLEARCSMFLAVKNNPDPQKQQFRRLVGILQRSDVELGELRVEMRREIYDLSWQRDEAMWLLKEPDLRNLFNKSWKWCIWLLGLKAHAVMKF